MLASSLMHAIVQISATTGPLFGADPVKPSPNGAPVAPGEPSTLVLALIGVSVIGAYFAITGRLRPWQDARQMSAPMAHEDVADVKDSTRDAA